MQTSRLDTMLFGSLLLIALSWMTAFALEVSPPAERGSISAAAENCRPVAAEAPARS